MFPTRNRRKRIAVFSRPPMRRAAARRNVARQVVPPCGIRKRLVPRLLCFYGSRGNRPFPSHFVHRGPKILLPGAGCLITGTKPVPLQAGHISSTTSDLIGFICGTLLRQQTTRSDRHIFRKMSNQLCRVTLNGKVKLNVASLPCSDFSYIRL
jgi:hypothetical protein